ncbi:MFS transporter [Streptomyces sp. NPDC005012]|uniref:MFS transporter n=1 Tax=unclassified Streptomyces TaxID=2593676 RepID=UPI0033B16CDF
MEKGYALLGYLAGAGTARAGDEMSGPALLLAGFALTGSAVEASALLAGVTVSAAVGGPLLGAFLDRVPRPGRLLAVALGLYAAGLVAILVGLGRLPFAVTVVIAVFAGLLGPALSGGWTAQLPRVLPGDRLPRANALDAMTFDVAALAGPALAGGVTEALGAPAAVVVAAALIALAAPAAWRLPARAGRPRAVRAVPAACLVGEGSRIRAASLVRDLAAGLRVVVGRPALARATLTSVVSCAAQGVVVACVPLLGERVLGGAGRGALLLSCAAVSALAANAVLARHPRAVAPDTIVWASACVQAASAAAAALWAHPAALVLAMVLMGLGEGPQLTALFAVRHREAPENLRGQIFTTGASLKLTGFALGAAVAGPVASWSLRGALALAAGVAILAAAAFFALPRRPPRGDDGR